ncbi:MAG: hypothetical protein DMG23_14120 [Acidobacteria bacterium]|nr:MAG: hypothetical protein DMG23_14120 [Acidobacteriota bacterium]
MRTGITRGRAPRGESDILPSSLGNGLRPGALLPRLQAKQNPFVGKAVFVADEKARRSSGVVT